jgi:hypothetical protein
VGVPGEEIGTRAQQEAYSQIYKEPFMVQGFRGSRFREPINGLTCEQLQING